MKLPTCVVLCVDLLACYVLDIVGCLFLRATNFADFVDLGFFHEICFTKN